MLRGIHAVPSRLSWLVRVTDRRAIVSTAYTYLVRQKLSRWCRRTDPWITLIYQAWAAEELQGEDAKAGIIHTGLLRLLAIPASRSQQDDPSSYYPPVPTTHVSRSSHEVLETRTRHSLLQKRLLLLLLGPLPLRRQHDRLIQRRLRPLPTNTYHDLRPKVPGLPCVDDNALDARA